MTVINRDIPVRTKRTMKWIKKGHITNLVVLFIGIAIGIQIPTLVSDYNSRKSEQKVMEQIALFPKDSNNWLLVSQFRWLRGDRAGSFEAGRKAIELNPNNILAMEKMAYNYIEMGDLDHGREWLEKALSAAAVHAPARTDMLRMTLSQIEKMK